MMTILKPAVQSSVQDLGRHGFHHLGVGASGAMDRLSLVIGNYLVGNACDAAGLELCMPPARIRLDAACAIALTGADCSARLDDTPVDVGRRVLVEAGQTLDLSAAHAGIRAYLCVSGGIDVPQVLGSRSTDLQAGMGGLDGRVLRRGDVLQLAPSAIPERAAAGVLLPRMDNSIRILPGPEFDGFAPEARDALFKASWTVTTQSNRMGYRLAGPALLRQDSEELKSQAVFPGVIQVPPGGAPIVLMADAQVTGGYPKIAAVIAADQWRLAQIPPGAPIQFAACTRAQALLAWQKQQHYLQRMQRGLHAH
jgi:5-oxoprolinase (ATP-hydrolysing) subunit C